MGYTTDFFGSFRLDRPLQLEHVRYLHAFSRSRRMRRNPRRAAELPDRVRLAVNLPIGDEGGYFVGGTGAHGQDDDPSVLDHNRPPAGQPGLWCKWAPSEDQRGIVWNGAEKFYDYVEWLEYIIQHFLGPWGYVLNGEVRWEGEGFGDTGIICIADNRVTMTETDDNRDPAEWGEED